MARRRYLVAYDIREDRRLRQMASCIEGYGQRIQYSVFVCDLSAMEVVAMRVDIEAKMKHSEDSVMVVDLGRPDDAAKFLFIGQHEELPSGDAIIV